MVIQVQSRRGNLLIGVLGLVYTVSAVVLLITYVAQTWNAAGLIDRAMQMVLVGAVLTGCWFMLIAARSLRASPSGHRASRPRRATAAA